MNTSEEQDGRAEVRIGLRFVAAGNAIDADTLVQTLRGTLELLAQVQARSEALADIRIQAMPPAPGSFLIDLQLALEWVGIAAATLTRSESLSRLRNAVGTVRDVLDIRKHFRQVTPTVTPTPEGERIITPEGVTINGNANTIIFYQNSAVGCAIDRIATATALDPGVTGFEVLDESHNPIFSADKATLAAMAAAGVHDGGPDRLETAEPAELNIISVAFEPQLLWGFYWKGQKIRANVTDSDFWERVNMHQESFRKGDLLTVTLEYTKVWEEAARTYVNRNYRVTRIHRHIPGGRQRVLPL